MAKDWAAVAATMKARLEELGMSQADLIRTTKMAPMTIREILFHEVERKRSPRTLEALSVALRFPPNHLACVLDGADIPADPLGELRAEVVDLRTRVAALEANRQHGASPPPSTRT